MNPETELESTIQTLMDFADAFPYHPDHSHGVDQIRLIYADHSGLVREIYATRNGHQGSGTARKRTE